MRGLIVVFGALLLASPAWAQSDEGGSAIELARQHMERGQALYLQARFEEAAAEFDAAYDAQPFSAFLYNAGVALERAGQPARAASYFERYLSTDPSSADADAVRARIAELRAAAAASEAAAQAPPEGEGTPPEGEATAEGPAQPEGAQPEVAQPEAAQPGAAPPETAPPETAQPPESLEDFKSLLSVRTNPAGATIRVMDGDREVASGPTPFAQTLDEGRYHVIVEHPDFQTVEQDVRIDPGKVYVVIVEMSQGQFLGYLRVQSNVAGAQVFLDDREQGPRGQTPFETPIPIGTHQIWVERPGYQMEQSEVEVGIGEDLTVRLDLTRVDFGRLRVVANIEGARVIVDDLQVGVVPFEGQVSAGPHRVRVESDGMKAFEQQVTIRNGQLTPMRVRLRPGVDRGSAWVTTVFTALFIGGGVTLALIGNDFMSGLRAEQDAGRLTSDDPRIDQGLFLYIGADVAFGLSVILGGLALYYFVHDPLPPSEGSVREARDWAFAPMVDPVNGGASLGFVGRF
ncbi:MAG TPA: hypothetical protein DEF51_18780 [Myxococcales bacterium]|nr:hypothetical protein [Myxococcales bacterium]